MLKRFFTGVKQYFVQLHDDLTHVPTLKKLFAITIVVPSVLCGITAAAVTLF